MVSERPKYYYAIQNNSGGYCIENEYVAVNVIIEANNLDEATKKFNEITKDYNQYCDCCGRRWGDFNHVSSVPFDTSLLCVDNCTNHNVIIHYLNGDKEYNIV